MRWWWVVVGWHKGDTRNNNTDHPHHRPSFTTHPTPLSHMNEHTQVRNVLIAQVTPFTDAVLASRQHLVGRTNTEVSPFDWYMDIDRRFLLLSDLARVVGAPPILDSLCALSQRHVHTGEVCQLYDYATPNDIHTRIVHDVYTPSTSLLRSRVEFSGDETRLRVAVALFGRRALLGDEHVAPSLRGDDIELRHFELLDEPADEQYHHAHFLVCGAVAMVVDQAIRRVARTRPDGFGVFPVMNIPPTVAGSPITAAELATLGRLLDAIDDEGAEMGRVMGFIQRQFETVESGVHALLWHTRATGLLDTVDETVRACKQMRDFWSGTEERLRAVHAIARVESNTRLFSRVTNAVLVARQRIGRHLRDIDAQVEQIEQNRRSIANAAVDLEGYVRMFVRHQSASLEQVIEEAARGDDDLVRGYGVEPLDRPPIEVLVRDDLIHMVTQSVANRVTPHSVGEARGAMAIASGEITRALAVVLGGDEDVSTLVARCIDQATLPTRDAIETIDHNLAQINDYFRDVATPATRSTASTALMGLRVQDENTHGIHFACDLRGFRHDDLLDIPSLYRLVINRLAASIADVGFDVLVAHPSLVDDINDE